MRVERKGTIVIKITLGDVKDLYGVHYVPSLAHNLLSVGQFLTVVTKLCLMMMLVQ